MSVSLTKGFVVEEWDKEQAQSPNKRLSRPDFCRRLLNTLNLIDNPHQSPDWKRALDYLVRHTTALIEQHKNAKKSGGKRKSLDYSEVRNIV